MAAGGEAETVLFDEGSQGGGNRLQTLRQKKQWVGGCEDLQGACSIRAEGRGLEMVADTLASPPPLNYIPNPLFPFYFETELIQSRLVLNSLCNSGRP